MTQRRPSRQQKKEKEKKKRKTDLEGYVPREREVKR